MSKVNISLILAIVFLILINVDACNHTKDVSAELKQEYKELEEESKQREFALIDSIQQQEQKIESYKTEIKSISTKRDTVRIYSSQRIQEAKQKTEEESEAAVMTRFKNFNNILVFSEKSDSIKLELRSVEEINNYLTKQLQSNQLINKLQEKQLEEKDIQLGLKDNTIELLEADIKKQKKKKAKVFFKGFAIGVGATATYILIKQL